MKVTDSKANNANFANEFKDSASNAVDDYAYDANGNMTIDNNKNITGITYNHLNLPTKITFGNSGTITYIYNATGQKVQKVVAQAGKTTISTDYFGGYQYKNAVLQFFPTAEGYVEPVGSSYKYVYQYKDHLGNVRLSYDKSLTIQEENNYYPFGLKHQGYGAPIVSTNEALKYKYNGKEWQDENIGGNQLNMYDYGSRLYDPARAGWSNVDPLAEKMRRWSPYNYCFNNPLRFTDPDGMKPVDWINWIGHDGKQHITYDPKIKTLQQAKEKGYSTATQVFSAGRGNNGRATEEFHFQQGGKFSVNGGKVMDVANGIYTAEGGSIIDRNKSGVEQISALGQGIGDGITAIGLATLNPAIAGAGEAVSNTFLGVEVIDNLMTEGISKETVIDNGVKVGLSVGFGEVGKAGVKGTQTVAGEAAVKAGENMVSESIIKATTTAGQKAAEKIIEDKRK